MSQVKSEECCRTHVTMTFAVLMAEMVLRWSRSQLCHLHQFLACKLAGGVPGVNLAGLVERMMLSIALMGIGLTTGLKWFGSMGCTDSLWPLNHALPQDGKSIQTEAESENWAGFLS